LSISCHEIAEIRRLKFYFLGLRFIRSAHSLSSMSTLRAVPDRSQTLTDRVASEVRAQMARIYMTQTALAAVLGLPQSAVSNRLRGKVAFSVDELEKVSDALGVHPATLLGGHAGSPPPPATSGYPKVSDTLSERLTGGNVLTLIGHAGAMRTTRVAA